MLTWVKNVGAMSVAAVEVCDVFFGPEGDFSLQRCGHAGLALGACGGEWNPSTTLKLTVLHYLSLPSGRYLVKVTPPNGISDEYFGDLWKQPLRRSSSLAF